MTQSKGDNQVQQTLFPIEADEVVVWLRQQKWSDYATALLNDFDRYGVRESWLVKAVAFKNKMEARAAERGASKPVQETVQDTVFVPPVPIGIFTVQRADGTWRTFKTVLQDKDASFAPNEVIISHLVGQDNDSDYQSFGFVKGTPENPRIIPWKKFRDSESLLQDAESLIRNPESALKSRNCMACNRTITTPSSISANLGPECAKKFR